MTPAELKDLLDRYARNEVTDDEKQLVDDWYASYHDGQELSAVDEERLKQEIRAGINKTVKTPARIRTIKIMRYAAAVTVLLVSVSLFIRKKSITQFTTNADSRHFTSIKTKTGEVKKVKLPDGSSVWLNAKSEIRISDDFQAEQQRYVYLDEGEAFFEVTKNPQRPFLVKTPHVTTKVLGTSFNVKAYGSLKKASVTVRTGKVQVNSNKKLLATLTPNMQVNYDVDSGIANITTVDASIARAWTTGKIILSNATFSELALALQNTYNIKLSSTNEATINYQYNLKINTQHTLDETLRIICSVHQNHYRRTDNEVILY
ncbi:FecR domain-containing protein [Mucilaginibacter sp. JRF]|uniref:FecR family protein n=1 Tax=Mucilaginibacter sp. JRF TaxID=2780088 RepID=UPI00188250FC|nr:FecR family protein [Mucilaginibacter sp. JRF]MBE9584949.1 FecR domain-containing protein [Mucilaginibacter sp. JRF]